MSMMSKEAPAEKADSTNQGASSTCTRHAMGNAIASAADKQGVDFPRKSAIDVLVNCTTPVSWWRSGTSNPDVNTGAWPTDFDTSKLKKSLTLQDTTTTVWHFVHTRVTKCCKNDFNKSEEFVLVYDVPGGSHCVYVEDLQGNLYICVNSHGEASGKRITVDINKPGNLLYKVVVTLQDSRPLKKVNSPAIATLTIPDDERLEITGQVDLKCVADYNQLLQLFSTTRLSIKATINCHVVDSSIKELAPILPILTKSNHLVVVGSGGDLFLQSTEEVNLLYRLSTTADVTYSVEELWLYCDMRHLPEQWLAELMTSVPVVALLRGFIMTNNICDAILRRLAQGQANIKGLLLYCDLGQADPTKIESLKNTLTVFT